MVDDPYVDPRSGVLKNRLGLTDPGELTAAEADVSAAALFRLEASTHLGEGHFDRAHLRALHAQIFGDLYPWAGKVRSVDIAKGGRFCLARNIDAYAATVFADLAAKNFLVGLDRADLVPAIGALYGELNALHPFREGNGRTQRAFLTRLGAAGGWRIRWADLDPTANHEASRRSLAAGDDSGLIAIIDDLLEDIPAPEFKFGNRRRAVLVSPQVAELLGAQVEEFRRGPFPVVVRCHWCRVEHDMADAGTVVLVEPVPVMKSHRIVFGESRCGRSSFLAPVPARVVRARMRRIAAEGEDATGIAVMRSDGLAGFAWTIDVPVIAHHYGEPVDPWLSGMLTRGFTLATSGAAPKEPARGWRVAIRRDPAEIRVVGPGDVLAFVGAVDQPPGWIDAILATGRCVLMAASRSDLSAEGLAAAAERGRLLVALAEAVVES